jgi:hypothetical protein
MAFNKQAFSPVGGQSTRGAAPQMFSYLTTTDNKQDIQVAGYFNGARTYLEKDDIINVIASDGYISLQITLVPLGGAVEVISAAAVDGLEFIDSKESFPIAVNNVITLLANVTYFITNTVDLTGDRLVCGQNTVIIGGSSENCRIKSTGLIGTALLSSAWSLPMRFITIEADIALNLDASANADQAIDWLGVNFTDCGSVGTIKTYSNFVMGDSAFLNSGDLTFDGSFGTIAFGNCLFEGKATQTSIILPATLTITRRFRIIYSSFIILSGETGINASVSATIPNEGYILDTINFTGDGTYTTGIALSDNKARINNCRGINNSGNVAQYYMNANASATTILVAGTYVKIAGTTTSGSYVEKFAVTTTNRSTYEGSLQGFYKITAIASISSGNNKVISLRLAKNGTTTASSTASSTSNSAGRSEGISSQDIFSLVTTDYVEVFITNETDTTAVTVEDLNVIIERLN